MKNTQLSKFYILLLGFICLFMLRGFSQSSTLLPNAIELPKFVSNPTCNNAEKGRLIFNTTVNKSYYCDGTNWIDMSAGGLTLPYSGTTNSTTPLLTVENTGTGRGIYAKSISSAAIRAESANSLGVSASSNAYYGIFGSSTSSIGIFGESQTNYGVYSVSYGAEFSAYLSGRANVSSRLAIGNLNYSDVEGRLHIKGENTGGWGQHIRLENSTNTGYGEILHDTDGFKFRNFQSGESFFFRNSTNTTIASINNIGELEVENGKGIVRSNDGTQLKTVLFQSPSNLNFNLAPNASVTFPIAYSAFSSTPTITVGQWSSGVTFERYLNVTVDAAGTNSATIRVTNVGSVETATATNASLRLIIIGPK